ncbi:MAG: S8 family serine peptidase [Patulibacter minatonensis]
MSARGVSRGVVARACGGLRRSLACRALIVGVVASICVPVGAGAEEQPAILKAYGLDWIERVKEEAWPQPRLERPVLCLLDTGVNITPDTPADDLNGPIVARLALDGGTGTAQGDGYPYDHGTQMASIIAAPRNGWGTVGVFPQARIVSIRVTEGTEQFISPTSIRQGVRRCVQFADEIKVRLAVVTIAVTNYAQRPVDVPYWDRARQFARDSDTLVIAAAGNDADSGAVAPLAVPDILSVSAGTDSVEKCPFVAQLDQTPALRGPGCSKTRVGRPVLAPRPLR